MSVMYCDQCGKQVDTDFDAEHFEPADNAPSEPIDSLDSLILFMATELESTKLREE